MNWMLSLVGIDGPYWLADPHTAIYAIGVVSIWGSIGYNMVIFLAGMQAIPREYYEAAELDGAGRIAQFFSITVPLLTPTIVLRHGDHGDQRAADVRPGLRDDRQDQPGAGPESQTVVYLFYEKGLRRAQRRVRRGDRLRAARSSSWSSRPSSSGCRGGGCTMADAATATAPEAAGCADLSCTSCSCSAPSSWSAPFVLGGRHVVQDLRRATHVPPVALPAPIDWQQLQARLRVAAVRQPVAQHRPDDARADRRAGAASARWPATPSRGCSSAARTCCSGCSCRC